MPDDTAPDDDGRARPFWSGRLSFGLVSIPVDLVPAQRTSHAALRMLDADGTPLARRYYCPSDEAEVDPDHIVRGYELDDGSVVVLSDEELEALAPEKSREIDLQRFVPRDAIDPLFFERSYFLAPREGSGKAYRLLASVMERSRRAGIATFVMRDKEYLVAIFAEGGLLRAETLRFHDEVRSPRDVGLPKPTPVDAKTIARMRRIIKGLAASDWDPSQLVDPHEPLHDLARRKLARKKDVITLRPAPEREGGEIIDLMDVLRRSLAESGLVAKASRRAPSARGGSQKRPLASARRKAKAPAKGARRSAARRRGG